MTRSVRDRIGLPSIEERIERNAAEDLFRQSISAELEALERIDDQREGPRHDRDGRYRDSETTQREAIRNIDKALTRALGNVDDKRIYPELSKNAEFLQETDPQTDARYNRYVEEMQADVRNNFMYDLYIEQLFDPAIEAISPSYPVFSLVVALKAALTAVATRPALCVELDITDRQLREDAITYLDQLQRGLHPHNSAQDFISSIMYEVPGIYEVAERILSAYEMAVTAERRAKRQHGDDTPLPNDFDADADRKAERDMMFERALVMVATSTEPLKAIAKTYGVGDKQLSAEAKRRGIARPQGRPKGG